MRLKIIILLFSSCFFKELFSHEGKNLKITILTKYQRSKKIWGTYGQVSQKTQLNNKKITSSPAANLMLSNGKLILIKPIKNKNIIKYKVEEFPYQKRNKDYTILTNDKLIEIYKENINTILLKNKIDRKNVNWKAIKIKQMNCHSNKRIFSCNLPIFINLKS